MTKDAWPHHNVSCRDPGGFALARWRTPVVHRPVRRGEFGPERPVLGWRRAACFCRRGAGSARPLCITPPPSPSTTAPALYRHQPPTSHTTASAAGGPRPFDRLRGGGAAPRSRVTRRSAAGRGTALQDSSAAVSRVTTAACLRRYTPTPHTARRRAATTATPSAGCSANSLASISSAPIPAVA